MPSIHFCQQLTFNLRTFQSRPLIVPHHIRRHPALARVDRVVLRFALVRTLRLRLAGPQFRSVNICQWQVKASRQACLVQVHAALRVGDFDVVDVHLHVAGGRQDVDALERVFGVHVDGHGLFEPAVHGCEADSSETCERGSGACEGGGEDDAVVCFAGAEAEGVAVGDSGFAGVFDCVALGCGEVVGFALEEGGGREIVLRVVGVFPDEEGGGCLDHVFATEEDSYKTGCWESFDGALFCELESEVGEAVRLLVLW